MQHDCEEVEREWREGYNKKVVGIMQEMPTFLCGSKSG